MTWLAPLPEPDEIALRAAVILGAPAAIVVDDHAVLGVFGLDRDAVAEVRDWLATDPNAATSHSGRICRGARAPWPGLSGAEVWVLGSRVRRLPLDAYRVLYAFMEELAERAA